MNWTHWLGIGVLAAYALARLYFAWAPPKAQYLGDGEWAEGFEHVAGLSGFYARRGEIQNAKPGACVRIWTQDQLMDDYERTNKELGDESSS